MVQDNKPCLTFTYYYSLPRKEGRTPRVDFLVHLQSFSFEGKCYYAFSCETLWTWKLSTHYELLQGRKHLKAFGGMKGIKWGRWLPVFNPILLILLPTIFWAKNNHWETSQVFFPAQEATSLCCGFGYPPSRRGMPSPGCPRSVTFLSLQCTQLARKRTNSHE